MRGSFLKFLQVEFAIMPHAIIPYPIIAGVLFMLVFALIVLFIIHQKKPSQNKHTATCEDESLDALLGSVIETILDFDKNCTCVQVWAKPGSSISAYTRHLSDKRFNEVEQHGFGLTFYDALVKVANTGQTVATDILFDQHPGKWYNARFLPVKKAKGKSNKVVSVIISDVTEHRLAAQALCQTELQLSEAQAIAGIGHWWAEPASRKYFGSQLLYTICEFDKVPEERSLLGYYLRCVHPDDINAVVKFLTNLPENPGSKITHRFITPEGNLKYLKVISGNQTRNDDGLLKRVSGIVQDVTEAKLTEKDLKNSRTDLIEAQRISKMGNWKWRLTNSELEYSPEVLNILETTREWLDQIGILNHIRSMLHTEDKMVIDNFIGKGVYEKGASINYRITTSSGRTKYINMIIGEPERNEKDEIVVVAGTVQDVSDRKQIESNFHRTERQYKYVLEAINLAALTLNKQGKITFVNQFLAQLLGYTRKELIGQNWFENFVNNEDRELMHDWFLKARVKREHENKIFLRNGQTRILNWKNAVSRDDFGNFLGITSIGEDVTEKRKNGEALLKAKEAAEKSSKFKSEFLSIMSHEIRTPMNAVIGATNLLMMDNPREDQMDNLNTLRFSGENLLGLINDILDYNKIEAGKLDIVPALFNLHELLGNITHTFTARAQEKGIYLQLDIKNEVPQIVIGDALRIGQILNNLLSNATKFTLNGGIEFTVSAQNISSSKEVSLLFIVTDTGIGISASYLKQIFDPFTQASQEIQANFGGTGLGLAITKKLVELQNGQIFVNSEIGKGSTFRFTILAGVPDLYHEAGAPTMPKVSYDANPVRSLKGMRILLVDDNQLNIIIGTKFLINWDAKVDQASDGAQGVEKVKANNYDLIIMDLQMPVMDGFEASRIIKGIKPEIPILALTADAMPETNQKAIEAGMSDYLTKPFVPSTLFTKISAHYHP